MATKKPASRSGGKVAKTAKTAKKVTKEASHKVARSAK